MTGVLPALEGTVFKKQDRGNIRVRGKDLQVRTDHLLQFFIWGQVLAGDGGNTFKKEFKRAIEQGEQDFLLGGNVVVQAGFL